jgi:hypothetical protein
MNAPMSPDASGAILERAPDPPDPEPAIDEDDVLVVRRGPGANCSSIGSALDVLFVTATIAGAILAAATAALAARADESVPPSEPGDGERNANAS